MWEQEPVRLTAAAMPVAGPGRCWPRHPAHRSAASGMAALATLVVPVVLVS